MTTAVAQPYVPHETAPPIGVSWTYATPVGSHEDPMVTVRVERLSFLVDWSILEVDLQPREGLAPADADIVMALFACPITEANWVRMVQLGYLRRKPPTS
jgi:hypothetical protein